MIHTQNTAICKHLDEILVQWTVIAGLQSSNWHILHFLTQVHIHVALLVGSTKLVYLYAFLHTDMHMAHFKSSFAQPALRGKTSRFSAQCKGTAPPHLIREGGSGLDGVREPVTCEAL